MDDLDTPDAGPSEGLSVDQAAGALSSLLDDPDTADNGDSGVDPKKEPAAGAAADTDAGEDAGDDDGDQPDGDAGGDPDAHPQMVTVKIDGKEIEVPLSEAIAGYQRQQDATRKTMQAAETRKAAETEIAQARSERQHHAQSLVRIQHQLEGLLQEQQQIDFDALIASDPQEAMRQQHLYQKRQAALQQTLQAQEQIRALDQSDQQQQFVEHLKGQQEKLLAKIPEWKDKAVLKAEMGQIREYLTTNGYSAAEIENVADHRAILNVRKAMQYDRLMADAAKAAKKIANTPKRVATPGSTETGAVDQRVAPFKRLKQSGSVRDAAAVFETLL
ncbi:hypothetical protein [Variovorax sp. DAIF25]|uniref:hypothetical protein n=1 Tax=Variovorax sp. DAIF25 TaxID=3080983 RepID=UPI003D6C5FB7